MSNLVIVSLVLLSLFLGDVLHTTAAYSVRCGVRPRTGRIIGGKNAMPHSWPWQCSLQLNRRNGNGRVHRCGCSVISPTWVITAGHCMFHKDKKTKIRREIATSRLTVVVGAHRIKQEEASQTRHYIEEAIVHERFLSEYINNDITLLRVNSSIEFNINVKPICVDASVFPTDTSCYITGWGRIDPSSHVPPEELQQVVVITINSSTCGRQDWYGRSDWYHPSTMICAGYAEGEKNICQGDSGGPLMCRAPSGRWKLVGLASWGPTGCIRAKKPGVYTRVEHYIDWIKKYVTDLLPSKPYRSRGRA